LPDHAERVREAQQGGEQRHEEGDLERLLAPLVIDAQDLGLDLRRLRGQQRLELGVAHDLGVVLEGRRDLCLLVGGQHRARVRVGDEQGGQRGEHEGAREREAE